MVLVGEERVRVESAFESAQLGEVSELEALLREKQRDVEATKEVLALSGFRVEFFAKFEEFNPIASLPCTEETRWLYDWCIDAPQRDWGKMQEKLRNSMKRPWLGKMQLWNWVLEADNNTEGEETSKGEEMTTLTFEYRLSVFTWIFRRTVSWKERCERMHPALVRALILQCGDADVLKKEYETNASGTLRICNFKNLTSLPSIMIGQGGIEIRNCPSLKLLPEYMNLIEAGEIIIENCQSATWIGKDISATIKNCPGLTPVEVLFTGSGAIKTALAMPLKETIESRVNLHVRVAENSLHFQGRSSSLDEKTSMYVVIVDDHRAFDSDTVLDCLERVFRTGKPLVPIFVSGLYVMQKAMEESSSARTRELRIFEHLADHAVVPSRGDELEGDVNDIAQHIIRKRLHREERVQSESKLTLREIRNLCVVPERMRCFVDLHDVKLGQFLNEFLKEYQTNKTAPFCALVGGGGLGKSTAARMIGVNPGLRRTFHDGIFWTELKGDSSKNDIQQVLRRILRALTSTADDVLDEDVSSVLQHLFKEKRILLIFDNIWNREQAEQLMVLPPESKSSIFFTGRNRAFFEGLRGKSVIMNLDIISDAEAKTLLENRLTTLPMSDKDEHFLNIVEITQRRPLVLAMVALVSRNCSSWKEVQELVSHHGTGELDLVQYALSRVDENLRNQYLSLFAFRPGSVFSLKDIKWVIGEKEMDSVFALTERLWEKGLLTREADKTFSIHDRVWEVVVENFRAAESAAAAAKSRYWKTLSFEVPISEWTPQSVDLWFQMADGVEALDALFQKCLMVALDERGAEDGDLIPTHRHLAERRAITIIERIFEKAPSGACRVFFQKLEQELNGTESRMRCQTLVKIIGKLMRQDGSPMALKDDIRSCFLEHVKAQPDLFAFLPRGVQGDENFARIALRGSGKMLQCASLEFRGNKEMVRIAVQQDYRALEFSRLDAEEEVKLLVEADFVKKGAWKALKYHRHASTLQNKKVILKFIEQDRHVLELASEELRRNPDLLYPALNLNGRALEFVPPLDDDVRSGLDWVAVGSDPMALQFASVISRNSKDLVEHAVKRNPAALQFASDQLKSDENFVRRLCEDNGLVLCYASEKIKGNAAVCRVAALQNLKAASYASDEVKRSDDKIRKCMARINYQNKVLIFPEDTKEQVLETVRVDPMQLQHASENFRDVESVVSAAIEMNGSALEFASPRLRADSVIVNLAVQSNGMALRFASDELRADLELVTQAMDQNPEAVSFAAPSLFANFDFLEVAVQRHPDVLEEAAQHLNAEEMDALVRIAASWQYLNHASDELRSDKEFIGSLLRPDSQGWKALERAPALRNNVQLFQKALDCGHGSWSVLQYAGEEPRRDQSIVMKAAELNWRALEFADPELLYDESVIEAGLSGQSFMCYSAISFAAEPLRKNPKFVARCMQYFSSRKLKEKLLKQLGDEEELLTHDAIQKELLSSTSP